MLPGQVPPIHQERHMRVICIGAGASGLLLAYKLWRSFQNFSLTVYEKNPQVSGTWFENKYPGCVCDIPSHSYTYTFEPKPDWSSVYASSSEIKDYFQDFAGKYDLHQYIKTLHKVVGAKWRDSLGEWNVEVEDLSSGKTTEHACDILINAGGFLNDWTFPSIPGLEKFKGRLLHSAAFDDSVQLMGKKIGLIGNGASGVQILPAVQPIASHVTTFIRSPTWILGSFGPQQRKFTQEEIEKLVQSPDSLMALRKSNEINLNSVFSLFLRDSKQQVELRLQCTESMSQILEDKALIDKLIPSWGVGCRRATPGLSYLKSLRQTNVDIVYGGVTEITEQGCKSEDGKEYLFDIIICATGFDTSYKPRFPMIGFEDLNLQSAWAETPKSYFGIAAAGFPNLLMFLGPSSPIANGSLIVTIEAQADHIVAILDRWQTENIHSFSPKADAVNDFAEHTQAFMKTTVWVENCRSGYKGHTVSQVPRVWPGSVLHYVEAIREVRADDWDIRYNGNRYAWLGNGYSQTELDLTSDLGYYLRDHDDSPYASRRRRREVATKSGFQPARESHMTLFKD